MWRSFFCQGSKLLLEAEKSMLNNREENVGTIFKRINKYNNKTKIE